MGAAGTLPELATVPWRPRADAERLRRRGRLWTFTTVAHTLPFVLVAIAMMAIEPLAFPVALAALAHAWVIPELYAQRGANVVRPRRRVGAASERVALGLLGDLVGHEARELHARTGLVRERGRLGTWLVGEAGALLVHEHGVCCWCVSATDPALPSGDRTAHLLLALRSDEEGFATVANLAFSGARWRVRRRLQRPQRAALDAV
ncbi:MAG: hypothetical protein JWQ48_667 [Conexibacter sp.]|nr:hypothetical protein [Conexibacter sp.]